MKILFLSDNFPPEVNAPASRTFEHCREWVKLGAEVTVITSAPNFPQGRLYEGFRNKLYQTEYVEGIKVIRVWTFITSNSGFALRILDYLSYAFMAFFAAFFEKADIIIATSPQFFTACSGYLVSLVKRKPWVFEVRDLWPESIKAVGAMKDSLAIRLLEKLELFLYHRATKIVSVTDSFKERMIERGVNSEKIAVIKNGVDLERFTTSDVDPTLRTKLGLEGKFIVGYVGTHGMAHGLDFILHSAKKIETEPGLEQVHFLLIGDGAEKQNLLKLHQELNLKNVTMLDPVPKETVVKYLNLLDVALVNLRKSDTFLTVLPSKIFEAAALGKPILLGVEGESKRLVESYQAGVCFEPENEEAMVQVLRSVVLRGAGWERLQEGGGRLALEFSRGGKAREMLEVIFRAGSK
ncbi:MAG: glycosyltransferase family 4 protein [Bdellovibrionales bacterium]|nr:glycosyltransferase family 4 protein [Bdellovibrionales bacterium]